MTEKEIHILTRADSLFMRCGIKSVTMDDVARELKVSKKTLYRFVKDKPDLVEKTMQLHCRNEQKEVDKIADEHENAIDELIAITRHVSGMLKGIHPSIHYDLEKYYPAAWIVFQEFMSHGMYQIIAQNLKRGIQQKLFRKNINIPIIAKIHIIRIDMVFDSSIFPTDEFDFAEVHLEMMRHHIRGIASTSGIEYLVEKLKQEKLKLL